MTSIRKKRYERKNKVKSSIIVIIEFCVVYDGLIYLSSKTGNLGNDMSNANLMLFISQNLFNHIRTISIEIVFALGCIFTSIGLLSANS